MGKSIAALLNEVTQDSDVAGGAWLTGWDIDSGQMFRISKENLLKILSGAGNFTTGAFSGNVTVTQTGGTAMIEIINTNSAAQLKLTAPIPSVLLNDTSGASYDAKFELNSSLLKLLGGDTNGNPTTNYFQVDMNGGLVTLGRSMVVGSPTGGDKGAGSVNAQSLYDDNVLLSCYVFDQKIDGEIDLDKWDAKVPNRIVEVENLSKGKEKRVTEKEEVRIHESARKFRSRVDTDSDPLNIDTFTDHWKEYRHLTFFPNEEKFDVKKGLAAGSWIQRMIEGMEIYAIHFDTLNVRSKEQAKQIEEQSGEIAELRKEMKELRELVKLSGK